MSFGKNLCHTPTNARLQNGERGVRADAMDFISFLILSSQMKDCQMRIDPMARKDDGVKHSTPSRTAKVGTWHQKIQFLDVVGKWGSPVTRPTANNGGNEPSSPISVELALESLGRKSNFLEMFYKSMIWKILENSNISSIIGNDFNESVMMALASDAREPAASNGDVFNSTTHRLGSEAKSPSTQVIFPECFTRAWYGKFWRIQLSRR